MKVRLRCDDQVLTADRYSGLDHTYENGLFDANWVPKGQLLPSILISNAPQLILSINYFMYNAIWTRLHSELEWNAFAISYRPLRVTSPKGEQLSTYRLQLPYLYSIPLIIGSIVLHWLVSNAIYVLVIEGGESSLRPITRAISLISLFAIRLPHPHRQPQHIR